MTASVDRNWATADRPTVGSTVTLAEGSRATAFPLQERTFVVDAVNDATGVVTIRVPFLDSPVDFRAARDLVNAAPDERRVFDADDVCQVGGRWVRRVEARVPSVTAGDLRNDYADGFVDLSKDNIHEGTGLIDLGDVDAAGMDLHAVSLGTKGVFAEGARFDGTTFSDTGTSFNKSVVVGASFLGADLPPSTFQGAICSGHTLFPWCVHRLRLSTDNKLEVRTPAHVPGNTPLRLARGACAFEVQELLRDGGDATTAAVAPPGGPG